MEMFAHGSVIYIMRSDGRIHTAVVSRFHEDTRSVTVEWYERGESKGKEIAIDTLLELNENLQKKQPNLLEPVQKPVQEPVLQQPTESAIPGPSNLARNKTQATIRFENMKAQINRVDPTSTGRASYAQRMSTTNNHIARQTINTNSTSDPVTESRTQPKQQQQQAAPVAAQVNMANNTVAGSVSRRSSCVVTVGMMEENRIKQRDMFKVIREKKNALMNQDGGNPNWEFINMIREYRKMIDIRPLMEGESVDNHQISVCVRKRPLNQKEVMRKEVDVVCIPNKNTLIVHEPKTKVDLTKYLDNQKFRFDYTFDENCSNEMVYMYTAKPLIQAVFEGAMATCFAYGQTGSGKTYTMGGTFNGRTQDISNGIYGLATRDIFELLHSPKHRSSNFVVSASFYEIYCGNVFDLLANKKKARVLEDGRKQVQVVGLTEREVSTFEDVQAIISSGTTLRTSGQTAANMNSSRSHAIFSLTLRVNGSTKVHGKFSFIDLAGNERGADTVSENRRTRSESSEINKSLLSLKECIRALGRKRHLPYRGSVLTKVLRDSFIGKNIRTCMIAMIAPGMTSCEHTLNTLRYAYRVKELAVIDPDERVDPDDDLIEVDEQANGGVHDLEQLRSLNQHEMSMELYNQHRAITDLQTKEEEVLDQHQRMNDFLERFLPDSKELYNLTNLVDYDQDAYCKRGEELFAKLAEFANSFKDLMSEFRAKLAEEEKMSQAAKLSHRN